MNQNTVSISDEYRNAELELMGPLREVTEEEREAFERDGFVVLEGILPEPWIEYLEATLADIFDISQVESPRDLDYGEWSKLVEKAGDKVLNDNPDGKMKGKAQIKTNTFRVHPGLFFFEKYSPLAAIVAELVYAKKLNIYEDQVFNKEAGSGVRTAFHQDASYFEMEGETCCVCWVSPDAVDRENGAMGYVRASHTWGKIFQANLFAGQTPMPGLTGEPLPDIEGNEEDYDIQYVSTKPGDIIIHDYRTLHGAIGNTSTSRGRRAASIRYATEGMRFLRRHFKMQKGKAPLQDYDKYNDGDPLDDEDYPLAWPID